MLFQPGADLVELAVHFRVLDLQLGNRHRGADTRDNVLALSVHQVLAEHFVRAVRGVAGERDARAAVLALVAENHRLDVDGGA